MKKLVQIKTAGFILKPNDPEIKTLYKHIKGQFEAKGISVILAERSADMINLDGVTFETMCKEADFLVSLGGDGTLLSLVRRSHGYNKPVVGINAGNLGFLADVTIDDVEHFLDQLISGDYRIDERMMIEGYLQRKGGKKEPFFFLIDNGHIPEFTSLYKKSRDKEEFKDFNIFIICKDFQKAEQNLW